MITIYHNPRCSKSREALAIAEAFARERGLALDVVDYISNPLTRAQLTELHRRLGGSLHDMLRDGEPEYATLRLEQADDSALLDALVAHPRLLQRPVVTYKGAAVIGRPPSRVSEMLLRG